VRIVDVVGMIGGSGFRFDGKVCTNLTRGCTKEEPLYVYCPQIANELIDASDVCTFKGHTHNGILFII
jgi:hypothetical protein